MPLATASSSMQLSVASLIQLLVIFLLRATPQAQVEATVGLYGPDRYEGLPDTCLMPMDFGYCRAKVQRYYFDIRRMKCNMFFWGGCAGNENNFKTLEECSAYCSSPYENNVPNEVAPKRERSESRGTTNTKYNVINSRDSSAAKSVPKFSLKPNVTSKETGYKGPFKASAKSFNVNPAPKTGGSSNSDNTNNSNNYSSDAIDDEEYDD